MCVIKYNFMNMKEVIPSFSEYFFNFWDFGLEFVPFYACVLTCKLSKGLNIKALFHKHLHMYFHERKCLNFDENFIENTHTTRYPNVLTH